MIETKLSTTHEVVVQVPIIDLAQMLLKDRFNANARVQVEMNQTHLRLVQYDRAERDSEVEPPQAFESVGEPIELDEPFTNAGHGHVWPRPDGGKLNCGGPGFCPRCDHHAEIMRQWELAHGSATR